MQYLGPSGSKELDAIPLVEGAVGTGWYAWYALHCL